jgi:hypothetical protein
MMSNEENFLYVQDNVFDNDYCKKSIDYINLLDERSILIDTQSFNHMIDDKGVNLVHHYDFKSWSWIAESFLPTITKYVNDYLQKYSILAPQRFLLYDVKVKKITSGGGFHTWHYESASYETLDRILVVQVYLNTIEDGGETEFLYLKKRVNAEEGRIIIFPAGFTHTHRGNPPLNKDKYIITTWVLLQKEG